MNTNEMFKTFAFLMVALVISSVAWFTRPAPPSKGTAGLVGKKLFPEFGDPGKVASLQLRHFDQKRGEPVMLDVAKVEGVWVITTNGKYPADASEHLAVAANSLSDLTILGFAPGFAPGSPPMDPESLRNAYNRLGVIDPDPDAVKTTDEGVGTRVTMKDAANHELASAIVGKTLPEQSDQCYLRIAGKEPVYVVKLDPSKLSVRFADWIEANLLKLTSMDLAQVHIKDYSIERVRVKNSDRVVLAPVNKGEFRLDLPSSASGGASWSLVEELTAQGDSMKLVPRKMAADEELNSVNLDALKSAVEDLQIVNVERKPAVVPPDLRVRNVDQATQETLARRGFYLVSNPDDPSGPLEVYSKFGEITLQMKDGARYILRFGNTLGESADDSAKNKAVAGDASSPGMDRYLFVMADFREEAIPKPVKEVLPPEEKSGDAAKPADAKDGKPTDPKDAKPADPKDAKPDQPKPADAKTPEAKPEEAKKPADAKPAETKATDPKPADASKDGDKKPAEAKPAEAKPGEAKPADVKPGEAPKAAEAKPADKPPVDPAAQAEKAKQRAAEQARIEREYQQKLDDYKAKIEAGKKHVKELNSRFGPWYYVIPGSTYQKIRLSRAEIIKKKDPPKDAAAPAAGQDHDHDHGPSGPAGMVPNLPPPGAK